MTALLPLAERLEKAACGSRELDRLIAIAMRLGEVEWDDGELWIGKFDESPVLCPYFTNLIDAALTLVRPEDDIDSYELFNDCGTWFVKFETVVGWNRDIVTRSESGCEHLALLFCEKYFRHIASLRAIAASDSGAG